MKLHVLALGAALLVAGALAQPRKPALPPSTPVTLNFVNADLEAVTRAMANMIGQTIVVDPRVKGVVTLYSEQPIKTAEAYAAVPRRAARPGLRGGQCGRLAEGGARGRRQAAGHTACGRRRQGARRSGGDAGVPDPLREPNNLVAVLRPLISVNNTINANPGNNTLVITDYADNLQRIAKIIAALDHRLQHRRRDGGAEAPGGQRPRPSWCSAWSGRRRRPARPGAGRPARPRCWPTRAATR
jgi:general secretion pathway protein D